MDGGTLEAARRVAAEARAAVRTACSKGVILAMPTMPGAPPRRDAPQEALHKFEDRALQLTAFAALAGAPVVRPAPLYCTRHPAFLPACASDVMVRYGKESAICRN